MLVFAYADWCGHCQQFKPEWLKFKNKYKSILDIREVNADKDQGIIEQMNVRGFPTVSYLNYGIKHNFEQQRNVENLEKFVKENSKSNLIFAYADWCGHCQKFKPTWNKFKAKYGKILNIRELNADTDGNMINQLGIRGFPTIMMTSPNGRQEFEGQRTLAGLEKFVLENNPHIDQDLKE